MKDIADVTNAYEVAQETSKSLDSKDASANSVQAPAKQKGKKKTANQSQYRREQQQQQRGRSQQRSKSSHRDSRSKSRGNGNAGNSSSIICYGCGSNSHKRNECKAAYDSLECSKCDRKGHVSKVCGIMKSRAQSRGRNSSPSPNRRFQRANANVATLKNFMDSKPTPNVTAEFSTITGPRQERIKFTCNAVLPDSGASTTIIRNTVLAKAGIPVVPSLDFDELEIANGNSMPILGTVRLEITFHGRSAKLEALVVENLAAEVLLGWQEMQAVGLLPIDFPNIQFPVISEPPEAFTATHETIDNEKDSDDPCKLTEGVTVPVESPTSPKTNEQSPEKAHMDKLRTNLLDRFKKVFSDTLHGRVMKDAVMTIELRDDIPIKPVHVNVPRAVPAHKKKAADELIQQLIKDDIIEPIPITEPTEWCSYGMFVAKPNDPNAVRLVTDYSPVNKFIKRSVNPFSSTRDIIRAIPPNKKYFATLDAKHGYFQVLLEKESRNYTAFLLESGRYRYKRGPQGMVTTGDFFNAYSDNILRPFLNGSVLKIVDDILVCGTDLNDLQDQLKKILTRCEKYGLTMSANKFTVGESVKFAGHIVSAEGVKPDPSKVNSIKNFPVPRNLTDVRSFLGLANQLGFFIPDLTHAAEPLHELTKKNIPFIWDRKQQEAFDKIKDILTGPLVVQPFDMAKPVHLYTDASRQGLGYALLQPYNVGKEVRLGLVRCGSRALTPAEKNYAVTELEALAVYYACTHCEFYLSGAPDVLVVTDHRALEGLWKKPLPDIPNTRVQRYRERLAKFNLTIKWTPGKSHMLADALSRIPCLSVAASDQSQDTAEDDKEDDARAMMTFAALCTLDRSFDQVAQDAAEDEAYMALLRYHSQGQKTLPPEAQEFRSLDTDNLRKMNKLLFIGDRLLVPKKSRRRLLRLLHASHQGYKKMQALAARHYVWPRMNNDIKNVVSGCAPCQALAPARQRGPPNENNRFEVKNMYPMSHVSMDLFQIGTHHYLVQVDRYSGYMWVARLNSLSTNAIIRQLLVWWSHDGFPTDVRSDNGPQFREKFAEFLNEHHISHSPTAAYSPSDNGLAENAVKQMKHLILKTKEEKEDFELALLHWRNTPKGTNAASPAQLFHHRNLRTNLPTLSSSLKKLTTTEIRAFEEERQRDFDGTIDVLSKLGTSSVEKYNTGDKVDIKQHSGRGWLLDAGEVIAIRPSGHSYDIRMEDGRVTSRSSRMLRPASSEDDLPHASTVQSILDTAPVKKKPKLEKNLRFWIEGDLIPSFRDSDEIQAKAEKLIHHSKHMPSVATCCFRDRHSSTSPPPTSRPVNPFPRWNTTWSDTERPVARVSPTVSRPPSPPQPPPLPPLPEPVPSWPERPERPPTPPSPPFYTAPPNYTYLDSPPPYYYEPPPPYRERAVPLPQPVWQVIGPASRNRGRRRRAPQSWQWAPFWPAWPGNSLSPTVVAALRAPTPQRGSRSAARPSPRTLHGSGSRRPSPHASSRTAPPQTHSSHQRGNSRPRDRPRTTLSPTRTTPTRTGSSPGGHSRTRTATMTTTTTPARPGTRPRW